MKTLSLLTIVVLLFGAGTAHAEVTYTPEQIKEMPRFSSIENQRCPKSRYQSIKKRLECKHEVRIEIFEKRQRREGSELRG